MFLYVCPKCGNIGGSETVEEKICKIHNCGGSMTLVKGTKEIPIHDINGRTLGTLLLTDEAINVLKTTGVSMYVDFDPSQENVIGYLH